MPRKPPKLKTAYETLPVILSIMTRSIDPILVSSAPYTAVPSTLSLPIREPVSLASVTIGAPPLVEKPATDGKTNRSPAFQLWRDSNPVNQGARPGLGADVGRLPRPRRGYR